MEMFVHILKRAGMYLAGLVIAVLSIVIIFSLFVWARTPVYDFPEPAKFHGENWYNPYNGLDSVKWYKANFHAHSDRWGKIANGRNNSPAEVFNAYREMGYEFMTLSNYQSITEEALSGYPFVPAQEYGINILKTHLLFIGSYDPVYIDQPFVQGANMKQDRINRNRKYNEIIALAHPKWEGGFTEKDMTKIGGYDLIEVLNSFKNSIDYWDIALSSGHPAFLLASDDTHDVFKNRDLSRKVTMVPHSAKYARFIYSTLRNGASYGIDVSRDVINESRAVKAERVASYPVPKAISVKDDSLSIVLSSPAAEIRFIGDGGKLLHKVQDSDNAGYSITDDETYVRIEAGLEDGGLLLFNPVLRSEDGSKPDMPYVEKSAWKTNLKIGIIIACLAAAYLYARSKMRRKKSSVHKIRR